MTNMDFYKNNFILEKVADNWGGKEGYQLMISMVSA